MRKVLIIAEAGVNHNGDMSLAKRLIDIAVDAKADIVKFQTFKTEKLVTKYANKCEYQERNTKDNQAQIKMLKALELSEDNFIELKKYCEEKKIKFLSTGFDLESLEFLKKLNMGIWKIPSGEITNLPYLRFIGKLNEKVIISTGMATITEIEEAIHALIQAGTNKDNITVLHCTTDYPAPLVDINLRAMITLKEKFGVAVGYSDHTEGIEVSVAAVALGAMVIEKHFTIDKNMDGPDHKASLSPLELKSLVSSIRNVELALGSDKKIISDSEAKIKLVARKSIVASRNIKKGEIFTNENLTIKRPGNGISPMKIDSILGQIAKKDFNEEELIEL